MFNCNKKMKSFYTQHVLLNNEQRKEMRERRDANRKRLSKGLDNLDNPEVAEHISQGSYAMHTMIQDENNDYDIDDGAVFLYEDLFGKHGAEFSALQARKMVQNALYDESFNTPPELKKNCIRVHYAKGYHVDVPVYRKFLNGELEHASSQWDPSCPREITEWYNNAIIEKSPDTSNGRQMRRITKLLKHFVKSRSSWRKKMPSGLILSVLIDECYVPVLNRDDESLYLTICNIRDRLRRDLQVKHPKQNEWLTKEIFDAKTRFLRDRLDEKIDNLSVLEGCECTEEDAINAWNKYFNHEFWKNELESLKEKKSIADRLRSGNSSLAVGGGLGVATGVSASNRVKTTNAHGGSRRIGKGYGGPWYNDHRSLVNFQRGVTKQIWDFSFKKVSNGKNSYAIYQFLIEVNGYGPRLVEIKFRQNGNQDFPIVIADGPGDSPHRYQDKSLCLWYPYDPKSSRWVFADGLLHLLSIIQAHLFREAWWREYGEWLGPEKTHNGQKKKF